MSKTDPRVEKYRKAQKLDFQALEAENSIWK